jgi:hypothetical protein
MGGSAGDRWRLDDVSLIVINGFYGSLGKIDQVDGCKTRKSINSNAIINTDHHFHPFTVGSFRGIYQDTIGLCNVWKINSNCLEKKFFARENSMRKLTDKRSSVTRKLNNLLADINSFSGAITSESDGNM